ncbi:MAG: EF-P 5-aminopentanol modification-associated protein YfmH [Planctomycetota bacterium]
MTIPNFVGPGDDAMYLNGERVMRNERLRETVIERTHASGLKVYLCPKPGYRKRYACFATDFGSLDVAYSRAGGARVEIPDGLAHFLEHKLFESEDGDAFEKFSRLGASANAYTTYNATNYLFACSKEFYASLDVLIEFVRTPHFTAESVAKEQGIIGEEISMYDDSAGWRIYRNLVEGLYWRHPVRNEILGSVESIGRITDKLLYECYETFYHPESMVLFAIGDLDPAEYFAEADKALSRRTYAPRGAVERLLPIEDPRVRERDTRASMVLSEPRLLVGYKDIEIGTSGRRLLEKELATDMLLDIIFGKGSVFFQRMYEQKLIDDNFSASYSGLPSCGFSAIGGETSDPDALVTEIERELARARAAGISAEEFERQRRASMGSFFSNFNSLEYIANAYCGYKFLGIELFDTIEALESLDRSALERRLAEHLRPETLAISVLTPK